jgi:hypothetical protein
MFCIAAFIVLAIISIFSARYRKLAAKAWSCTARRVTLRPCDTSFKEETKNKLLSHVAKRTPRLVRTADIGIEIASFALVILTIWSILILIISGLNLFVWGTCTPSNASSCSLSSESCSITTTNKDLWTLTAEGKPWEWFTNQANELGNTIANIPTRLQNWDATKYLPSGATYYNKFDSTKPTALEIIDPGCTVCAHLFRNIKQSGFENKYNLTYIAYPIKDPILAGKYKFANSYTVTQYLEAIRLNPLKGVKTSADWQILERIYTWKDSSNVLYQTKINTMMNHDETVSLLQGWLKDIGYTPSQINQIDKDAGSKKVADIITKNQTIVNDQIKTVKIPTIIFGGQRRDGLVNVNSLK